jgi:hypothetical protein
VQSGAMQMQSGVIDEKDEARCWLVLSPGHLSSPPLVSIPFRVNLLDLQSRYVVL